MEYCEKIQKYKMISHAETLELAKNKQVNDLVIVNLRLVVKIAKKYQHLENLDDIIQNGNIGLILAAKTYNPARNIAFSTYACLIIKQQICNNLFRLKYAYYIPCRILSQIKDKGNNILTCPAKSLDYIMDKRTLGDLMINQKTLNMSDKLEKDEFYNYLSEILNNLNDKEQKIFVEYFIKNKSYSQISEQYNVSKQAIWQKLQKIIKKINSELIKLKQYV